MMGDRSNDVAVADDANVSGGAGSLLETKFVEAPITFVPLSRLSVSPLNVRRKALTGIEGLADSILAKGLLQNLVAHPARGSRGKNPKLCVCAGQRRLAALQLLAEQGKVSADQCIPVKVLTEAEAVAASLIENEAREPMHAADQAVAFRLLLEEGRSIDYVAALFSIPPLTVQRRLKIANVSPKILDVYRDDGMTTEQIQALALCDDHDKQERLWFDAAQSWLRDPYHLREAIVEEEINVSENPLVAFVTLDAYVAAGGYVRRDLFSESANAGYITDTALLQQLATERLLVIAQDVLAEGWSFVETRVKRDFSELSAYTHITPQARDMTKKEAAQYAKLEKARGKASSALDAYYSAETIEEDEDKRDALEDGARDAQNGCEQFVEALEAWTPEQLASAGAFVLLNHAGKVVIERGYVKRGTATSAGHEGDEQDIPKKAKPVHSDKLCRRLTAHRTAAVQVELAAKPNIALSVLMQRLIPTVFSSLYYYGEETGVHVSATCSHDKLLREADDMEASAAWQEIEAERSKWAAMLPKQRSNLLPWLIEQSDDVMANLFAFCVASTLDSVTGTEAAHPVNALADLLEVDMTKYWTPTQGSYLNHVSKARIAEVVSTVVSPEAAAPLTAMKKDAAAATAELRLAGTGWLPEVLAKRGASEIAADDDQTDEPVDMEDDEILN
ncbi:ParB/RepB/Spo0J family partition protein [Caballeronia sp. SBC2]|uniref:ParB/RepB/Spo0J family partition protein n=1 Tax=Caballeronia sp. SBC2 TaxID=2705547 RepID=UPI0013E1282C|nr:ParB/RepB/Spo0J family partition protein [Caballeronia sp. SBC2]QIE29814.1 ParB-like nuclease domain protein [Caballeronia sp. SBC2]